MKRRHGSGPDPFEQSPRKRDATQPSPSQAYEHQFAPSPDPYAMDAGSPGAPAGEPNTPFVLAGDGSYAPPSGGSPPYDNYQQQHSYHGHTTQHSYRPHQSPPLVLTASPMQVSSAQFGHHQQRHEHLSPPQPHLSPASPSSMTSSYNYSTPALSTGTMSSSSSQDAFPAPPTHYPSPPAQQYYHPAGKQPTHAGKVFINPPGRAHPYAGRGTSEEPKGKGRERDWDSMGSPPAPTPVPTMSVPEESTRRGEDLGIGLGDFDMLDTLGTGTFGKVLLARLRTSPSRPAQTQPHYFAMKVLEKSTVVRLRQVEHLNSERSTLAQVSHPFIVNLFCTFQDERNLYLLLEYVQGGELFSHLRRSGRFSSDVARFFAANLILALEDLHAQDIIYRDLKPENLLIDATGYLKITDFGFAKHVTDRTYTLCGTPEYLAPEIITATGHGKAADFWAFGVLLFELLAGYPPFFADSPLEIYEKILTGKFAFPPHVDFVAKDLIRRLLTADLSKRLGNLKDGAADIKNHRWFEGVDWDLVERKAIRAPIIPQTSTPGDTSNFESYPDSPLETLPGVLRAARARQMDLPEDSFERGPDPYAYLFPSF